MIRTFLFLTFLLPCQAFAGGDVADLIRVMKIGDVFEVMKSEGISNGRELFSDSFPGRDNAEWEQFLVGLYDPALSQPVFEQSFAQELADQDLTTMIRFFETEPGRSVIDLELTAREAMLDPSVTELAEARYASELADKSARLALIRAYSDANRLVDYNVEGALNSNLLFLQGMASGFGEQGAFDEDAMLREIWGQEPEIRAEADVWVFSFLLMAYGPLKDEDIEALTAFSLTDAGQVLNRALFEAFNEVFNRISRELGVKVGSLMISEDI